MVDAKTKENEMKEVEQHFPNTDLLIEALRNSDQIDLEVVVTRGDEVLYCAN